MLQSNRYRRYFEVLELDTSASLTDVKRAYLHLKDLYSSESIVTSPIIDEFSEDNRQDILDQIEDAHKELSKYFEEHPTERDGQKASSRMTGRLDAEFEKIESFTGEVLKQIRERMGIEISDIALATKIRSTYIESIERERFDALPPHVYTRGFVVDYARFLQLDPDRVVSDYMGRYKEWKESES